MRQPAAAWLLATSAVLALGACANAPMPAAVSTPTLACAKGRQPMRTDWLYFAVPSPEGDGSRDTWGDFVDDVITPRFPEGITAWGAEARPKEAPGEARHVYTWVINIVHRSDAKSEAAIVAVVDLYKKSFHQDSVLRVSTHA